MIVMKPMSEGKQLHETNKHKGERGRRRTHYVEHNQESTKFGKKRHGNTEKNIQVEPRNSAFQETIITMIDAI